MYNFVTIDSKEKKCFIGGKQKVYELKKKKKILIVRYLAHIIIFITHHQCHVCLFIKYFGYVYYALSHKCVTIAAPFITFYWVPRFIFILLITELLQSGKTYLTESLDIQTFSFMPNCGIYDNSGSVVYSFPSHVFGSAYTFCFLPSGQWPQQDSPLKWEHRIVGQISASHLCQQHGYKLKSPCARTTNKNGFVLPNRDKNSAQQLILKTYKTLHKTLWHQREAEWKGKINLFI